MVLLVKEGNFSLFYSFNWFVYSIRGSLGYKKVHESKVKITENPQEKKTEVISQMMCLSHNSTRFKVIGIS